MPPQPTLARRIAAWIIVVVVVLATWKFVEYRGQPPPVPQPVPSQK